MLPSIDLYQQLQIKKKDHYYCCCNEIRSLICFFFFAKFRNKYGTYKNKQNVFINGLTL